MRPLRPALLLAALALLAACDRDPISTDGLGRLSGLSGRWTAAGGTNRLWGDSIRVQLTQEGIALGGTYTVLRVPQPAPRPATYSGAVEQGSISDAEVRLNFRYDPTAYGCDASAGRGACSPQYLLFRGRIEANGEIRGTMDDALNRWEAVFRR
ncbi:MAG TPA: hypothetical protein VF263_22645 [Longimicrobiaceae bacterium]